MTENEGKKPKVAIVGGGRCAGRILKAHIDLLEELEAYRSIGTVDECAEMQVQYYHLTHQVKEFEKIGTIEELQALKEKETPKKPIPNKPLKKGEYIGWHCPMCNKERWSGFFYPPLRFNVRCPICGQVIDWNFREYER